MTSHASLRHEFKRLRLSESDGLNLLANQAIISSNIIYLHEIAHSDLIKAIIYLKTL